ncbi:MAG: DNA/RNA nuclease SfsA [Pseudomonadota bacterium]
MEFPVPLEEAVLLRRYKRFLADISLPGGEETTVHCPNPGAMLGVAPENARCWVSRSPNKARKLPLTLEIVECPGPDGSALVGINTHRPNALAEEALRAGRIKGIEADVPLRREVRYGEEKSRIDLLAEPEGSPATYIEVKNCHFLRREDRVAEFPDCVTARGLKHLRELIIMVEQGHRALMLFIVQRGDAEGVAPAEDLDPKYADGLREAAASGVEIQALRCDVSPTGITATTQVPIIL